MNFPFTTAYLLQRIGFLSNKDSGAFICIQSNLYAYLSTESLLCILENNFCKKVVRNYTTKVTQSTSHTAWVGSTLFYTTRCKLLTVSSYITVVKCFLSRVVKCSTFLLAAESTMTSINAVLSKNAIQPNRFAHCTGI